MGLTHGVENEAGESNDIAAAHTGPQRGLEIAGVRYG